MAAKPLTTEAIALTEKKMDMTLDDIIRMSKNKTTKTKKQRVPNKNPKVQTNAAQEKSAKVRRFMDSRSSLRQGALAQKRSSFHGNQFPLAAEAARKAVVAPLRNRAFNQSRRPNVNKQRTGAPVQRKATYGNFIVKPQLRVNAGPRQRPQTLDSLFANMKEQRMRAAAAQSHHHQQQGHDGGRRSGGGGGGYQQRQQQQAPRGRGRFGNY